MDTAHNFYFLFLRAPLFQSMTTSYSWKKDWVGSPQGPLLGVISSWLCATPFCVTIRTWLTVVINWYSNIILVYKQISRCKQNNIGTFLISTSSRQLLFGLSRTLKRSTHSEVVRQSYFRPLISWQHELRVQKIFTDCSAYLEEN